MKRLFAILNVVIHVLWFGLVICLFLALGQNQVFGSTMIDIYESITQTYGYTLTGFYEEFVNLLILGTCILVPATIAAVVCYYVFARKEFIRASRGELPKSRREKLHLKSLSTSSSSSVISGSEAEKHMKEKRKAEMKLARKMRKKELYEAKLKAKLAALREQEVTTTTTTVKEVVEQKVVKPVVETKPVETVKEEVKITTVNAEPVKTVQAQTANPVVTTTAAVPAAKTASSVPYSSAAAAFKPSGNSELDAILRQALARKGRR